MKKDVSPAMIAVAIVALVAVIALVGFKTLGPASKPPPPHNAAYEEYSKSGVKPAMSKPGSGSAPSTVGQ